MILDEMYHRYNILKFFKTNLTTKGHTFKELGYINSQIELLDDLIRKESFSVLGELLRKTNFRLLKKIETGGNNLPNIVMYPEEWILYNIDNNYDEWLNREALIFSTERQTLVFTKTNNGNGFRYINNKWQ